MGMKLREMGRLRKIAVVLLRHGLGHLVDKLGLSGRAGKGESPKEEVLRLSEAERVRMASGTRLSKRYARVRMIPRSVFITSSMPGLLNL